ncbi:MAG: radical SAM protein [Syntrophomonadaceae bacterium]
MSIEDKKTSNNELAQKWQNTEMTMAAYAAQRHIPLGGTFELTPRCNLKCKMCYVRLDRQQMNSIGREMTAKEWITIAEAAADAGTLNLLLTGGEPLIRADFEEIYTALSTLGFIITLNTNATLMTPDLLNLFKKYPPTATNVTLYGASPQTYEKICGNPDDFGKTIDGLEMLSKVPTVLEVRTTFIKDNAQELDAIRAIANQYTKRYAINTMVNKPVRGAVSAAECCRLTPSQIFDIDEANENYYKELNSKTEDAIEYGMEKDNFSDVKYYGFDLPPKIITCLAAKSMYWITWDGKMLPCGSFSSPYTLPLEEGFRTAWDRLPTLFEDIMLPQECRQCEYSNGSCSNCPAILQTESGSFDKISRYICETAKERALRTRTKAR